jgi:hypothetical protein
MVTDMLIYMVLPAKLDYHWLRVALLAILGYLLCICSNNLYATTNAGNPSKATAATATATSAPTNKAAARKMQQQEKLRQKQQQQFLRKTEREAKKRQRQQKLLQTRERNHQFKCKNILLELEYANLQLKNGVTPQKQQALKQKLQRLELQKQQYCQD